MSKQVPLPAEAFQRVGDFGFMSWRHGVRDPRVYDILTNSYAFSFDPQRLKILTLTPHVSPLTIDRAFAAAPPPDQPDCPLGFTIRVIADGKTFELIPAGPRLDDIQLIESGRWFQRRWQKLKSVPGVETDGLLTGLEISSWPDRLAVMVQAAPAIDQADAAIEMELVSPNGFRLVTSDSRAAAFKNGRGQELLLIPMDPLAEFSAASDGRCVVRTRPQMWHAGVRRSCGFIIYPSFNRGLERLKTRVEEEASPLAVSARQIFPAEKPIETAYDPVRGWHAVRLSNDGGPSDPDRITRTKVTIRNDSAAAQPARLCFEKTAATGIHNIPGVTMILCDADGYPTGIPIQYSKNWHGGEKGEPFQGGWFRGLTELQVPARTTLELQVVWAGQNWGGVPAASHSQLCLVGWGGGHQQWDEAAIGAYGETWCYEAEGYQAQAIGTDSRAILLTSPGGQRQTWTGNVGGCDFLRMFDPSGRRRWHTGVRTMYRSYGPCLSDVVYAGQTDDGSISFSYTTETPRVDDFARAYHHIRYDVGRDVQPGRLAFFQLGSDSYNYGNSRSIAVGDCEHSEATARWTATFGEGKYIMQPRELTGTQPWVALCDATDLFNQEDKQNLRIANRGMVVRSWRARLGGVDDVPPYLAEYSVSRKAAGRGDGSCVDIVPPPGVKMLKAGDFVEADIERIIVPIAAEHYYGPDESFRAAAKEYANRPELVAREAIGNHLRVEASVGRVERAYPVCVRAAGNQAEFTVTGGVGYVPITLTNLSSYRRPVLEQKTGDRWVAVDQSRHGNDFWQCDFDPVDKACRITFNVRLDGPEHRTLAEMNDRPATNAFRFSLARD